MLKDWNNLQNSFIVTLDNDDDNDDSMDENGNLLKCSMDDSEDENEVKEALGKEDSSKKRKRMRIVKSIKFTKS